MPAGTFVGSVFFLLLSAAVITSMVALLEIPVAAVILRTRFSRRRATVLLGTCIFVLGIPSALSYGMLSHIRFGSHGILDTIDYGVSNFFLPVAGILTALYVGWRLERAVVLHETDFGEKRIGAIWLWLIRILVPATILGILVQSVKGI